MNKIQAIVTACLLGSLPTLAIAQTAGQGLDALNDDRMMAELASRGMSTLLERAFEINKVPQNKRDGILTLIALRQLSDSSAGMSTKQRQELITKVVTGIEAALPSLKDPNTLMTQAGTLIKFGIERDVNTLEYWGENPRTQASLRPVVETVIKILDKTTAEATEQAEKIGNSITNPNNVAAVQQWEKMDQLATNAAYTRHMVDYYLALSMDKADGKRKVIADEAIEFLKQYDVEDYANTRATVRNRIAKLQLAKGDYPAAKDTFATVADDKGELKPDVAQVYEAKYFTIVADLLARKFDTAQKELDDLSAWQKANLPADKTAQDGAAAAAAMMQFRIYSGRAEAASGDADQKKFNDQAILVLTQLQRDRPELRGIISEQLAGRLPDNPDLKTTDPLLLQALIQKGEGERLKPDGQEVDKKILERAIAAGREYVSRKGQSGIDTAMVDNVALLIPFFEEKLDRRIEAGNAFLDYAQKYALNEKNAEIAMGNAQAIIGELRKESPEDTAVVALYERFLPMAIGKPFQRYEFAFEYARRLQLNGKFKEAAEFYALVPESDKRLFTARFYNMIALKQMLDDANLKLDGAARTKTLSQLQNLAAQVNAAAQARLPKAATNEEKLDLRSKLSRTTLLAADVARREQKEPKKAVELLTGFEELIQGLPNESDLIGEALFIRVNSYMSLGQTDEATRNLVALLNAKPGNEGAGIAFTLLQKLNQDLDKARAANDVEQIRLLARNRAQLSGFLVDWAANNSNPDIKKNTYTYARFDAATKQLAADLETDPAKQKAGWEAALAVYRTLQDPAHVAEYQKTIDPKKTDPNYPDPIVMLGVASLQYNLGNIKEAQPLFATLLGDRKLGTPTMIIQDNGQDVVVDNDQYWEATYKLYNSNVQLANSDGQSDLLEQTKIGLKKLYIQWGDKVGGKKWKPSFEELRQQIIPDFKIESLDTPATSPTAATPPPHG